MNSRKALEWISLIGLRRTSVRVPEHCRYRHEIQSFLSVPSKRSDDVLSVLEMVWVNCAGPMNHLISDMGVEFEGELGEFMEAHGIRQYFTASEAPWQNRLVERNCGIGKVAARKAIKDVGVRGFVEIRRLWRTGQGTATSTRLDTRVPNGSSVEDTNCRGRFWMRSKVENWRRWSCQITHLSSVDECHDYGVRGAPSKPWTLVPV